MSVRITDLLLLLAAAQGLFLTVLIFHKHRGLFANRFVGALTLLYSLILLHLLFGDLGYSQAYPRITLMIIGLALGIPPLHYLYAKHLVHNTAKPRMLDWLHALPFALYQAVQLPKVFASRENMFALTDSPTAPQTPLELALYNWVILLQGLTYMVLTLGILRQYARDLKEVFSNIDRIKLDWLSNITYMAIIAYGVFGVENVFLLFGVKLSYNFSLSSALVAVYVYALGYLGMFKSEVFSTPEIAASISLLPEFSQPHRTGSEALPAQPRKYEKSGLSEAKAGEYLNLLLSLMDQKHPYTNSDLTLNELAEMLVISAHNLSEVLNTQLQQNFFDFVNSYRLEKVKKDLADPTKRELKLLAIAFEAGFNSKSSFNTIFKKETNLTPSEYRLRVLQNPR